MSSSHGTSVTIAHKIFEEGGLRAGEGIDLNERGVFVIGRKEDELYSLAHSWKLARNRAKCHFCSEWYTHQAPSAWSMPVVIMFPHATGELTRLKDYKDYFSSTALLVLMSGFHKRVLVYCYAITNTWLGVLCTPCHIATFHFHNVRRSA